MAFEYLSVMIKKWWGLLGIQLFLSSLALADGSASSLFLCASELNQIHAQRNHGDLFYVEDDIAFTSVSRVVPGTLAVERRLIVMNISGIFEFLLPSDKEVMIRVDVPHRDPRRGEVPYFFRYQHGKRSIHRAAFFSANIPDLGLKDSDYLRLNRVSSHPGSSYKSVLKVIDQKIRWIEKLVMSHKLSKKNLAQGNLSLCKNIATRYPQMSNRIGNFAFRLESLSPFMQVRKPTASTRMPASL